jgi:hypothetical protein
MTLTKLQTLYRAAVAAEPNLGHWLHIDEHGQWVSKWKCPFYGHTNTDILRKDWQAAEVLGVILDAVGFKLEENEYNRCVPYNEEQISEALERIARKEASK